MSGFKAWALAHLLVVGSVQGVILFGGLLAWAVVSVIVINRANRDWTRPPEAALWREGVAFVAALFLMLVVGQIHGWLGPWPFGGGCLMLAYRLLTAEDTSAFCHKGNGSAVERLGAAWQPRLCA